MRSVTQAVGLVLLVLGAVALVGTLGVKPGLARDAFRWLVPLGVIGVGLWVLAVAAWSRPAPGAGLAEPPGGWSRGTDLPQGLLLPGGPAESAGAVATPFSAAAHGAGDGTSPASGRASGAAWGHPVGGVDRMLGGIEVAGPLSLGPARFQTLIGEVRLDLARASLPFGETPVSVGTLVGEIRVLLPPDVGAIVRGRSILGEVEVLGRVDGPLFPDRTVSTGDYPVSTRRIRLDVQSGIGRVAVRRARAAVESGTASSPATTEPTATGTPGAGASASRAGTGTLDAGVDGLGSKVRP